MTDHDGLYHRLFSDPRLVAELLRGFVAGPWLDDLDVDGMTRLNAKFHAPTLERRDSDVIWCIPRRSGGEAYLVLLLEFQSNSDPWMSLRVLVYVGLLWQHLITENRLLPDGKLPPVLPVVLHNGGGRWGAPLELRALIGLPEGSLLWRWQPALHYYLVDEVAYDEADLARREGLVPLLFRLENSPDPERVVAVVDALLAIFAGNPGLASLRPVFVEMLAAVMGPLAPGLRVPAELLEVRSMLAARAEIWKQQWKQEGLQQGLQQGRQQGLQQGRQEGEAALLLRLLERRFGPLPGWAQARIADADRETLENWGLRLLDGGSLEDVLA
jgi:hypothetical protein